MADKHDEDEQDPTETPGGHGLGGDYARDEHYEGLGDDYARDGGWSGGGRADDHTRDVHPPAEREKKN